MSSLFSVSELAGKRIQAQSISSIKSKELTNEEKKEKNLDNLKKLIQIIYVELKKTKNLNKSFTNLRLSTQKVVRSVYTLNASNTNNLNNLLEFLISYISYNFGINLTESMLSVKEENSTLRNIKKTIIAKKLDIDILATIQIIYKIYIILLPSIVQTNKGKSRNYGKNMTRKFINQQHPGLLINVYNSSQFDIIKLLIYIIAYFYDMWLTDSEVDILYNEYNNIKNNLKYSNIKNRTIKENQKV